VATQGDALRACPGLLYIAPLALHSDFPGKAQCGENFSVISTLLAGTIIAKDIQEVRALFFEAGAIEQVCLPF